MHKEIHQRILKAAAECFTQRGYAGTSVKDICQSAGVAPATLYRHFRNKQALFEAVELPDLSHGENNPRRKDILEAALDVFSRQGYHGTTMTEVASVAGVARATLYAQFPTKESLLSELLQENPVSGLTTRFSEQVKQEPGGEPAKDLEVIALQFLRLFQDSRKVALFRLVLVEGIRYAPLQRAYHQMINSSVRIFSRFLIAAEPALEDPQFVAQVFIGSLLGFVLTQQVVPGTILPICSPEEIARRTTALWLNGVAVDQS
jgi:AcrR family transcriptional regulator